MGPRSHILHKRARIIENHVFQLFYFFGRGGIIGRPFRHNRSSWRHKRTCPGSMQLRECGIHFQDGRWTWLPARLMTGSSGISAFKVNGAKLRELPPRRSFCLHHSLLCLHDSLLCLKGRPIMPIKYKNIKKYEKGPKWVPDASVWRSDEAKMPFKTFPDVLETSFFFEKKLITGGSRSGVWHHWW